MKAKQAETLLADREFLDRLYSFSYRRCGSSYEAEDLASDIVTSALRSLRRVETEKGEIESFRAFIWTVARRVYADYCKKRRSDRRVFGGEGYCDEAFNRCGGQSDPIGRFIEDEERQQKTALIWRELSRLSSLYREVTVMYYLEEKRTAEIAQKLGISESAVKQRLFTARAALRQSVSAPGANKNEKRKAKKMDEKTLKDNPIRFIRHGDGDPVKSYPYNLVTRMC